MSTIVNDTKNAPFADIFKRIDSLSERCFTELTASVDLVIGDVVTKLVDDAVPVAAGAEADIFGIVGQTAKAGEQVIVGVRDLVVINDQINFGLADVTLGNAALEAKGIKLANDFSLHQYGAL
jgi:hypothetical protein